jgi:hypothetical protein
LIPARGVEESFWHVKVNQITAADLEIFFGDANDVEARVYARLPGAAPRDAWEISGKLTGPECQFAKTLPATIGFIDRGTGAGLLAEAVAPDPCFWTPELPFLYRCTIEIRNAKYEVRNESVEQSDFESASSFTVDRWIGIRRLGRVGRSFHLDGKRWVARGVCRDRATITDLNVAREAAAALHVPEADEEFCLEASRLGVPLIVGLDVDSAKTLSEIRRLGQWPAVFAIALDPALVGEIEVRAAAKNVLFAARIENMNAMAPPVWADFVICPPNLIDNFAEASNKLTIPIIAVRKSSGAIDVRQGRAACDKLQFDLAPIGDFAGYFV